MRLFSKKKKIDYDELFKQKYKSINQIVQSAHDELDYDIKRASLKLAVEKYDELIELIDQGANFDRQHFIALKESVKKEIELIQGV